MSNQSIYERLEDLHNVLVYCSELQLHGRMHVFKTGERICINQEIASLYDRRRYLFQEKPLKEVFVYRVPESIENKLKQLK